MAKDVDISVIGPQLEVSIVNAIPTIENFFHPVVVITEPEANRALIRLMP